jgi:hypothetical protein
MSKAARELAKANETMNALVDWLVYEVLEDESCTCGQCIAYSLLDLAPHALSTRETTNLRRVAEAHDWRAELEAINAEIEEVAA